LKETIPKTCSRASKRGKSENSIAWEAVTVGKNENSQLGKLARGGKVKIP
jgi:hypothetical protein